MRRQRNKHPIPARASVKGGRRACLCPDNTYHPDCCDGSLLAQGIGRVIALMQPDMDYKIQHETLSATQDAPLVVEFTDPFTTVPTFLIQGFDGGEWVELTVDALDETGFTITPAFDCVVNYVAIETIS